MINLTVLTTFEKGLDLHDIPVQCATHPCSTKCANTQEHIHDEMC